MDDPDYDATTHPQRVVDYAGEAIEVDEGIADLLKEIWRAGIGTIMSCQDNPTGRIWIHFSDRDATVFLNTVVGEYSEDPESLYNRAVGELSAHDWEAFRRDRAWDYRVSPFDFSEPDEDFRDVGLFVAIRFPHADHEEILRTLRAHNERDG